LQVAASLKDPKSLGLVTRDQETAASTRVFNKPTREKNKRKETPPFRRLLKLRLGLKISPPISIKLQYEKVLYGQPETRKRDGLSEVFTSPIQANRAVDIINSEAKECCLMDLSSGL